MGSFTLDGVSFPMAGNKPTEAELGAAAAYLKQKQAEQPRTNAGRSRETDEPPEPTGPPPDQYGVHNVGETTTAGRYMPALRAADDVVRQVADTATFGLADKAVAGGKALFGDGTYDDNLAKERKDTEAAGERLPVPMRILANIGGGALTGSALARAGLTLLGNLPRGAPLIQKLLAGGAEGGLYGAASGAGHTDSDDPGDYAQNAWQGAKTGAVVGAAVPAVAGVAQRVVTPFPADSASRTQLVEGLRNEGVTNITAGQATGNPVLRYFEDVFAKLPLGGNPARGQMEQVTQAAMQRAGLQGTHATSDVLADGFNKVGGEIGALQRQYPIQYSNQMIHDLVGIQQGADVLSRSDQGIVNAFINRALRPGATLDPTAMQALRTDLRLAMTKGEKPLVDRALAGIRDTIDDALEQTIRATGNAADVAALQAARGQYANLHVLTDAISRSGASGERGVLTPTALKAALEKSVGKTAATIGEGDNAALAAGSRGILTSPPESGTATRFNLLEPHRAVMGPVGRALLNNRYAQRYWGNQVAPNPVPPGLLQPGVTGAAAGATAPGPADRLVQGLLMGGP